MTDGWKLLAEGNPHEALEYFDEIIADDNSHFANHLGRGKCLLLLNDSQSAIDAFEKAINLAVTAWSREEISYDQVEAIEKELDAATGDYEARIVDRIVGYIHGCLNITGVYSYNKVIEDVGKLINLKTKEYSQQVLRVIESDNRFVSEKDQLRLSIAANPQIISDRRRKLGIKVVFELDKIARYRSSSIIDEWKDGISMIVAESSQDRLAAEDVIKALLNAETLKDAMHELEQKAHGGLKAKENQWERFIFNLWVALPRWELAGLCLNESKIEDLWLGDMSKAWIGSVLGLMVDGDGDYCCPECREKVVLYDRHTHGGFDR